VVGVVIAGVVLVAGSTGVVVSTHDYHCHTIIATTTDHYTTTHCDYYDCYCQFYYPHRDCPCCYDYC
jgi:hypothetical protein